MPRMMSHAERDAVQAMLEECLYRKGKALSPDIVWGPGCVQAFRLETAQGCLDWPCILVAENGCYTVQPR